MIQHALGHGNYLSCCPAPCYVDITGNGFRPCCIHMKQATDVAPAVFILKNRKGPCCVHITGTDLAPAVLVCKSEKSPCCVHIKKTKRPLLCSYNRNGFSPCCVG